MSGTFMLYKGIGDILAATVLTVKPSLLFESTPVRMLASWTGLHLSSAEVAPGFNQSIACMAAAVGVGHIVAARGGPSARKPIFAINVAWTIFGFLTCLTPREWDLGSATLLLASIDHLAFSAIMFYLDSCEASKKKAV